MDLKAKNAAFLVGVRLSANQSLFRERRRLLLEQAIPERGLGTDRVTWHPGRWTGSVPPFEKMRFELSQKLIEGDADFLYTTLFELAETIDQKDPAVSEKVVALAKAGILQITDQIAMAAFQNKQAEVLHRCLILFSRLSFYGQEVVTQLWTLETPYKSTRFLTSACSRLHEPTLNFLANTIGELQCVPPPLASPEGWGRLLELCSPFLAASQDVLLQAVFCLSNFVYCCPNEIPEDQLIPVFDKMLHLLMVDCPERIWEEALPNLTAVFQSPRVDHDALFSKIEVIFLISLAKCFGSESKRCRTEALRLLQILTLGDTRVVAAIVKSRIPKALKKMLPSSLASVRQGIVSCVYNICVTESQLASHFTELPFLEVIFQQMRSQVLADRRVSIQAAEFILRVADKRTFETIWDDFEMPSHCLDNICHSSQEIRQASLELIAGSLWRARELFGSEGFKEHVEVMAAGGLLRLLEDMPPFSNHLVEGERFKLLDALKKPEFS